MRRLEARTFYLFLLPWAAGFLVFGLGPVLASLALSFTDYNVVQAPLFTGFNNYRRLLTADSLFLVTLGNTAFYTVIAVPLQIVVSFGLALLLNLRVRGVAVYRTFFYLPSVVPAVASSILWIWILEPQWGLLNSLLHFLGIAGPPWLGSVHWSKPALILMSVWSSGGSMIIFLAGLQGVPQQLYEAAMIDGAGQWARFRHVTVPMMTPTIFFVSVIGIIGSFQVFTAAYIMTSGGPDNSTLFYMLYLYRQAFHFLNMGYAAAMAWLLLLAILALTLVQLWLATRWVYYEGGARR
ncbi:MAG: sugar ABC transporter permease [Chloroflexi bacterium]|nr:sugar ABC transporter permease [Chloroflexota bacterium]